MIILIGPDGTGKTTLARRLEEEFSLSYFHYTVDSGYSSYLGPMCGLGWTNAVLDRHAICEFPYSKVMNRKFKFTLKEWHNLILTTLIQNPMIVLCDHKPDYSHYKKGQYLPYDRWDDCLRWYKSFLSTHHIPYMSYDYARQSQTFVRVLVDESRRMATDAAWWRSMWEDGRGCIGSTRPKVLLIAERIGPNNMNNIPFETGPTGQMLSDLLLITGTPLGKFTVTNMVKSFRRDTREPNDRDRELLSVELEHLKPEKVIFMGSVSAKNADVAIKEGIPTSKITHFGYHSHRGSTSVDTYVPFWKEQFGITPAPKPL